VAARHADRDADAHLAELAVQDVRAVARALHPALHDRAGGAERSRPSGEVLTEGRERVRGYVPSSLYPVHEAATARAVVREVIAIDHVAGVPGGCLRQPPVDSQWLEATPR